MPLLVKGIIACTVDNIKLLLEVAQGRIHSSLRPHALVAEGLIH